MKVILLLLTCLFTTKAFSQLNDVFTPKPWDKKNTAVQPKRVIRDLSNKQEELNQSMTVKPTNVTDNGVLVIKIAPEYKGNNGKGADIYSIKPYNMPCIVPDSTFQSRMPVKNYSVISKPD